MTREAKIELLQLLEAKAALQKRQREESEALKPAWSPHPKNAPQTAAYHSTAYIVGYGGAAGGGKTAVAIGKALMQATRALFVRSEAVDLEAVVEWITSNVAGRMNHVSGIFKPTGTRGVRAKKIKFTHLSKSRGGVKSKQGNEYDYVVFEEATNLPEDLVRTMLTWIRSTTPGQNCQAVLTFNPPATPEGMWVAGMFAPWVDASHPMFPVESGTVLYVAMIGNEEVFSHEPQLYTHDPRTGMLLIDNEGNPAPQPTESRVFFRATVKDNPFLTEDYVRRLMQLPERERNMYLYGQMDSGLVDAIGQIVRKAPYGAAQRRWQERIAKDDPRGLPPTVISLDLAEGGKDRTVITPIYHGGFVGDQHIIQGSELGTGADNVTKLAEWMELKWGVTPETAYDARGAQTVIVYDGLGSSGGAFQSEIAHQFPDADVRKFVGSKAAGVRGVFNAQTYTVSPRSGMPIAQGDGSFSNKISAAWVRFGQMLEHPAYEICLPPGLALQRELMSRLLAKVREVGKGQNKTAIESKVLFTERLKNSPDLADSVVMGIYMLDRLGNEE